MVESFACKAEDPGSTPGRLSNGAETVRLGTGDASFIPLNEPNVMKRIIRPQSHESYKKKRFQRRNGFFVARDPYGRYVKVRKENVAFIPKEWKVYKNMRTPSFYEKKELNEMSHCLLEITSRKHARWFESVRNINIGILFGRIKNDTKTKKNLFGRAEALSEAES